MEIDITLKNQFDRRNPEGFTTENLHLEIALNLEKPRAIDDLRFVISIHDTSGQFEIFLLDRNDKSGSKESISSQLDFPFLADKPMRFELSVPIQSSKTDTRNLLGIIRELPENKRLYESEFQIDVTCYLKSENLRDKTFTKTFAIDNPFYGRYQWATDTFSEPNKIEQNDAFLPEALSQISNELEEALLEVFELHKDEISEIAALVDGISYDILPHERYAAISFRTTEDEEKYSPADWENYSLIEYRNCDSDKFKAFSRNLFQTFFEIYASSDEFDDNESGINDLLFTAIAKAVLRPSIAEKLRDCGISNAPTISGKFDKSVEYIVSGSETADDFFNYCEAVISDKSEKPIDKRIRLDKFN